MSLILDPRDLGLALQTRKKSHIENTYDTRPMSVGDVGFCDLQLRDYNFVSKRGRPCRKYNCHGMTFAARRSAVADRGLLQMLQDDEYYQITELREVLAGDVVLYWLTPSSGGTIEHSGIVIYPNFIGSTFSPTILSKWGCCYELIHNLYDAPYSKIFTYHRVRT